MALLPDEPEVEAPVEVPQSHVSAAVLDGGGPSSSSLPWRQTETNAFIQLQVVMQGVGVTPDSMWLVISNRMTAISFSRSPAECIHKWDSLVDTYGKIKKAKRRHKSLHEDQKRWQYFHAMVAVEFVRASGSHERET